jgi:hypothetical protein
MKAHISTHRMSPNPAEVWDEFMSFLKPSLFQPTPSVGLRGPIRYITSPTFLPERTFRRSPIVFSQSPEIRPDSSMDMGQVVTVKQAPANGPGRLTVVNVISSVSHWISLNSGSPISRIHTRNPFQRHPSYDIPAEFANSFESPRLLTLPENPISPRKAPLPSPSVDGSIADTI